MEDSSKSATNSTSAATQNSEFIGYIHNVSPVYTKSSLNDNHKEDIKQLELCACHQESIIFLQITVKKRAPSKVKSSMWITLRTPMIC